MKEGCAQEQKRVALGRGHQDTEAIDAARQAPPPPFQPSGFSLRRPIFSDLLPRGTQIPSLSTILATSPSPGHVPRAHYTSIYVSLHLTKSSPEGLKTGEVQHVDVPHAGLDQLFSPGRQRFWITTRTLRI